MHRARKHAVSAVIAPGEAGRGRAAKPQRAAPTGRQGAPPAQRTHCMLVTGSAWPAAQPGGEQGGERPGARGHTQQRARQAPSPARHPSHTDTWHLHQRTGSPGGGPVSRSPQWERLQGAWSWPRLGSRMETPHNPPRPGCPWEHLSPCLQGGSRATFGARGRAWATVSPSPAQGISRTHLRRPASTTNCPWGLQKMVLACCLSNISERRGSEVSVQLRRGQPVGVHTGLRCCTSVVRGGPEGVLKLQCYFKYLTPHWTVSSDKTPHSGSVTMGTHHQGKESSFYQILKDIYDPHSLKIHSSDSLFN